MGDVLLSQDILSGRDRELRLLEQMLDQSGGSPAFLVGPGGVGKTALCHMYAQTRGEKYSATIFVSVSQFSSPAALLDYVDFENAKLNASGDRQPNRKALLILDYFDAFEETVAS
jgi:replication-associated recombination protein RarA